MRDEPERSTVKLRQRECDRVHRNDAPSHKDIIDNILYASGVSLGLLLLTLNDQLKKFVLGKQLKDIFISPDELAEALKEFQEAKGNRSN
jgi:hypothetical protein